MRLRMQVGIQYCWPSHPALPCSDSPSYPAHPCCTDRCMFSVHRDMHQSRRRSVVCSERHWIDCSACLPGPATLIPVLHASHLSLSVLLLLPTCSMCAFAQRGSRSALTCIHHVPEAHAMLKTSAMQVVIHGQSCCKVLRRDCTGQRHRCSSPACDPPKRFAQPTAASERKRPLHVLAFNAFDMPWSAASLHLQARACRSGSPIVLVQ